MKRNDISPNYADEPILNEDFEEVYFCQIYTDQISCFFFS